MVINNPYWEEVRDVIAVKFPFGGHEGMMTAYRRREELRKNYAYSITSPTVLEEISKFPFPNKKIVEIGAGSGYWAHMLTQYGMEVKAFDDKSWKFDKSFYKVELGGPLSASEFPDHTLMLCWPPYGTPMAADCVKYYTGDYLIYLGEGTGGCTGDDDFHEALYQWEVCKAMSNSSYEGIHDQFYIFKRK